LRNSSDLRWADLFPREKSNRAIQLRINKIENGVVFFAWPRRASFSVASAVPQVDGFFGEITFQENAEEDFNPRVPLSLIFFRLNSALYWWFM